MLARFGQEALYSVALALGLRQGEALGLRWQDIDIDRHQSSVSHALQRIGGRLELVEPKTRRSRRTMVLPVTVADALRRHRDVQAQERRRAGSEWVEADFVFTTQWGKPLDGSFVRRDFPRLLDAAGLPPMRFHDLRHSCASLLLAQGVAARTVMEVLGHSQISLTLDTYSHVMPQLVQDAANAMDKILHNDRGRGRGE